MRAHLLKDKDKNPFVPITHIDAVVDSNNTSVSLLLNESEQRLQAVKVKTDILITNGDGDLFLANDGTYKKASSGSTKETLVISLINNLNNPSMLIGASVEVLDSNENLLHRSIWDGLEIQVVIDAGIDYTITVGQVQEFATPEPLSYTASLGATRLVKFQYNTTAVTVNLVNDSLEPLNGTATVSYDRYSYEISNGLTVYVPYGKEITITPTTDIEYHKSPEAQTFVANSVNKTCTLIYKYGHLIVNMLSNQLEDFNPSAFITYGDNTAEVANGQPLSIPTGTQVTITFQDVENYKTPDPITFVYNGGVVEKFGTYLAEKVIVNVTATDDSSMNGLVVSVSNGKTYSVVNGKVEFLVAHGSPYTVSINDKENYKTPQAVTYTANQVLRTVNLEYVYHPYTDLSLQDIYGNPIAQTTANCYVVREPGVYRFPLVFGNAITNGEINLAAYTNNGGANSHDFVDGVGNVISSPYLSFSDVVSIRNSDTDGLISNTKIINEGDLKFVIFDINSIPSTGGNIILSVDAAGAIMWSWHIWLWPYDLSPVEITNSTGVKYNIMPVNLASKYDADGVHIKNWFYQWGRPNPMLLPSAWNSTTDHTPGVITKASKASNLQTGIANPTTFYYNSTSPYNWFGDKSYYNLWDAACTSEGASDNDTVKTVYDPCPVGWKVPNGNTFTGLSILSSANGVVKMARYSGDTVGVGFPVSGYRYSSDGSLRSVGSVGCVWLSSAVAQTSAFGSEFNSSNVFPHIGYGRSRGLSVRPVQDIALNINPHKLTINLVNGTRCTIKQISVAEDGTITEGSVIATQNTATATHDIPWGMTYKIFLEDIEGYATPETQVYQASVLEREVTLTYILSSLTVNIASNQSNDTVINGLKATVNYNSVSKEVANGLTITIPLNTQVTITFPASTGYKKPDDIVFINTGGNVTKTGTYQTEIVKVSVTTDNGVSASGLVVTINGTNYTFSGSTISVKIPFDTTYSVSVNDMVGYTKPESRSFTASQVSRRVTMQYTEIAKGVFIALKSGTLINKESWTSDLAGTAAGIALITDRVNFIIGFDNQATAKVSWGSSYSDTSLPSYNTVTKATSDFNGYTNTNVMISELTSLAAESVVSKTITYGGRTLYGYLGSAGEWLEIINNYDEIHSTLYKMSQDSLNEYSGSNTSTTYFWTSTEYSEYNAWTVFFGLGNTTELTDNNKMDNYSLYCVVPFYKLY